MKNIRFLEKTVPEIFKIPLRLRDPHISIWQSPKILNISFSLTLKRDFINWSIAILLKVLRSKTRYFGTKLLFLKPILTQIDSGVQNGPTARKGALQLTTF